MDNQPLKELKRAANFLLDNHEFNMVYEYAEASLQAALLEGSFEDAETNLRNHRALTSLKQLMENMTNG